MESFARFEGQPLAIFSRAPLFREVLATNHMTGPEFNSFGILFEASTRGALVAMDEILHRNDAPPVILHTPTAWEVAELEPPYKVGWQQSVYALLTLPPDESMEAPELGFICPRNM